MPMSLKRWLDKATPAAKAQLAKRAKLSPMSISHIARGHRRGSADTAIRLWRASGGEITLRSVCPALKELEPHLPTRG